MQLEHIKGQLSQVPVDLFLNEPEGQYRQLGLHDVLGIQ